MKIKSISISNLRAIKSIQFAPGSKLNFILGTNGSGKTSLLESVYLLSRAKSFRTHRNRSIIKEGEERLSISAVLENQDNIQKKISLTKTIATTAFTAAGKKQTKFSQLVKILPIGIITPDSQKIIHEGPKYRRLFLDWGVFHVEHGYMDVFKSYKKILNQRNCLLRVKNKDCKIWDKELCKYGESLNDFRKRYFAEWAHIFKDNLEQINTSIHIDLEYEQGWSRASKLESALEENFMTDLKKGYTSLGPHRADIIISSKGHQAKDVLSRGQIKLLTIMMVLSQMSLFTLKVSEKPIILIDDLDAELDQKNQILILDFLEKYSFQTFITMINNPKMQSHEIEDVKVFHVEHGEILKIL